MKRVSIVASLLLAMSLATSQIAYAARVYNFLPDAVHVKGLLLGGGYETNRIKLDPGQRSESLTWKSANMIRVDVASAITRLTEPPLCLISFGVNADMQGGNYMTIGHHGNRVVCTMCGSEHNVIKQWDRPSNYNWQGSSRTGC